MAALLYLGAGVGVGLMDLFHWRHESGEERLGRADLPYTVGMILLDIAAPVLLMAGVSTGTSANASLLGNFEIVATTLIALWIFHEKVSARLWAAIGLITAASMFLSFEGTGSFRFSLGSVFVLGAAKTSAYYAAAPFLGVFLSFALLHEALSAGYLAALAIMLAGTVFVVRDADPSAHASAHTPSPTRTTERRTPTASPTTTHTATAWMRKSTGTATPCPNWSRACPPRRTGRRHREDRRCRANDGC